MDKIMTGLRVTNKIQEDFHLQRITITKATITMFPAHFLSYPCFDAIGSSSSLTLPLFCPTSCVFTSYLVQLGFHTPSLSSLPCVHPYTPHLPPTILTSSNSNFNLSPLPSAEHGHRRSPYRADSSPFKFMTTILRWNLSAAQVSHYISRVDSPTSSNLSLPPPQACLTS